VAAEHQADAAAFRLRREEWDEEVRRLRDAGAVVFNKDLDLRGIGGR
jgi:hypothetical protein